MDSFVDKESQKIEEDNDYDSILRIAKHRTHLTVIGYGSLLNLSSALRTFPNLTNFRLVIVRGFFRRFSLVSLSCIKAGVTKGCECASAAIHPCECEPCSCAASSSSSSSSSFQSCCCKRSDPLESVMLCTAFEIPVSEAPAFFEREHRYRHIEIPFENVQWNGLSSYPHLAAASWASNPNAASFASFFTRPIEDVCPLVVSACSSLPSSGIICLAGDDEWYQTCRCKSRAEFEERVLQHYSCTGEGSEPSTPSLWARTDILPVRNYLRLAMRGANSLGESVVSSFLDSTQLADCKTSLREFLIKNPEIVDFVFSEHLEAKKDLLYENRLTL